MVYAVSSTSKLYKYVNTQTVYLNQFEQTTPDIDVCHAKMLRFDFVHEHRNRMTRLVEGTVEEVRKIQNIHFCFVQIDFIRD